MDIEGQTIDTVATQLAREDIFVLTCDSELIRTDDGVTLFVFPDERCIDIRDMSLVFVHLTREDIESHLDDTVAAVQYGGQGIEINAVFVEEERRTVFLETEPHRVAFADRSIKDCMHDRQNLDINRADTIITVMGLGLVGVETTCADFVLVLPCIGHLIMANGDGIQHDVVRLVDNERQAVDTVTTVDVR